MLSPANCTYFELLKSSTNNSLNDLRYSVSLHWYKEQNTEMLSVQDILISVILPNCVFEDIVNDLEFP